MKPSKASASALQSVSQSEIAGNWHLPVFTFDFSGPHTPPKSEYGPVPSSLGLEPRPHEINLGVWRGKPSGVGGVALPAKTCFEDLRALTGGSRPRILRLHSDKASEFLTPTIRAYLSQQGVRQTVNSGYDPQDNGGWLGIVKARATALLADVRLPPDYWSYACRWVT